MDDELREAIRKLPDDAFREPENRFTSISPLERLRWLQQTAFFVWKFKGAAQRLPRAEKATSHLSPAHQKTEKTS
jgi:hypothetical protein